MHGVRRATDPVQDLAVLAGERGDSGRLGTRHADLPGIGAGPALHRRTDPRVRQEEPDMTASRETEVATDTWDMAALRASLTLIYRQLDEAVASHGPVCALSGRCCRFSEYGHTLF